jgi:hypothetical protein
MTPPKKALAAAGVATVALVSAMLGNKTADEPPDVVNNPTPDPLPATRVFVPPIIVTRTITKTVRIRVPVPGPVVTRTIVKYVSRAANRRPVYSSSHQRLIAFGHWLEARNYNVSENPEFGGVGGHSPGSPHYRGDAIDVNADGPDEQQKLGEAHAQGDAMGLRRISRPYPGHGDHDHYDTEGGPNLGGQ